MQKFWQALQPYFSLMRLDRPVGIFLLLWPTLIALFLASGGYPDLKLIIIFTAGVVIMRSAGCVINDYTDRNIDPFVTRTKNRPLATGALSAHKAKLLFVCLMTLAFLLAMQLKQYTLYLSLIAAALVIMYPLAKRFSNFPQVILGLAFSWCIPMVYAEVQDKLSIETWLLFISNLSWVVAYDTEYAMADKIDDLKIGVKSTAITFGNRDKLIIALLQLISLLGFAVIGYLRDFSIAYYVCLLLIGMLIVQQQLLIRNRNPDACLKAFKSNNLFGLLLLVVTCLGLYSYRT